MADLVQIIRGGVKRAVPPSSIDGNARRFTPTATKTAAYTAAAWDHVLVDASAAAGNFAVTMPGSPSVGDQLRVTMVNDHATRVVTLNGNGSDAIETDANNSPGKYTLVLEGDSVLLEWVGGGCGWAVIADQITSHHCRLLANSAQTTNTAATVTIATNLGTVVTDIGGLNSTSDITVRRAGLYLLGGQCIANSNVTAGKFYAMLLDVNGAWPARQYSLIGTTTTTGSVISVACSANLAAGDVVSLAFYPEESNRGLGNNLPYLSATELR